MDKGTDWRGNKKILKDLTEERGGRESVAHGPC